MKKKPSLSKAILLCTGFAFASVSSAQVATEVIIQIPGRAFLDYYTVVNVTIPAADFAEAFFEDFTGNAGNALALGAGTKELDAEFDTDKFVGDADIEAEDPTGNLASYNLVLENVYAIRTNRPGTMSVQIGTAALTGPNASSITMSSPSLSLVNVPRTGLGASQALSGDVTLALNLTNALSDGEYTGGTYELEFTFD